MKSGKQDQLAAKLRGGRQIAEIVPTKDARWVLVVFDDGSKYRATMEEAMSAMTADSQEEMPAV